MRKQNNEPNLQTGMALATILMIVAGVVLVGGGATYFLTDGFGTKSATNSTVADQIEDAKPTASSKNKKTPPSNMPKDMPVYSEGSIASSKNSERDNGFSLGINVPGGDEDEIIDWYLAEFAKTDWVVEQPHADRGMLEVSKDGFSGSVTIMNLVEDITTISYLIKKK